MLVFKKSVLENHKKIFIKTKEDISVIIGLTYVLESRF